MLSQAVVAAVRRLQNSDATSKIIVLLTDGAPSQGDIPYEDAIKIAQQIGVKIYTIGVGSQHGGYYRDPLYGVQAAGVTLNKPLLQKMASGTGGRFFEAHNPEDVKKIYDMIDQLEKTTHEVNVYNKYYDYFLPFLWAALFILLLELLLKVFIWFRL